MIYPTLFIGLGSTGLDVLEKFQELVIEHYGRSSLEIFRYIALESRSTAEVRRLEWGNNDIRLLKPVITSTDSISNSIESGHKTYLKEWLNTKLLEIDGRSFTDGASNIRMAGRLILWENWDSVSIAMNEAYNQITSDNNKKSSEVFLKKHYARHKQPIDDKKPLIGDLPNIYIVGTLCGGTCSGMFIDIGYYIKQITGLWAKNLQNPNIAKIHGIFSIFDSATLNKAHQEGLRAQAANCWSALMEYDFFCNLQTRYRATFPNDITLDTNERPIDWLYLISSTATDCNNNLRSNFRKAEGNADIESLNHMAATILFTETIGNLLETKEAIRTDYRAKTRAIHCNEDEHSPCIASCGAATIWHPKYRIAVGAACKYGVSLCGEWLGEIDSNTRQTIENEISDRWHSMLTERVDELTSSATGTIMGDVKQKFDKNKDNYLKLPTSQFKGRLHEEIGLLNKGKVYDSHISDSGRMINFKTKVINDVYNSIENILSTKGNLAFAEYYLEQLDKMLQSTIKKLPSEYPSPNLGRVKEISIDIFARLVFKSQEVEMEIKEEILNDAQNYIINEIKNVRNFRMKSILEEILEEIGITRKKASGHTVKQHLNNIRESLINCVKDLGDQYTTFCKSLAYTQDVKVVSQYESISGDIDHLVTDLKNIQPAEKREILDRIMKGRSITQFLEFRNAQDRHKSTESIKKNIKEQLIHTVLERVGSFDVIDYVSHKLKASEIAEFAKHGLPHLELTPGHAGLASTKIGRPVSFIAGGDKQGLDNLLQNKLSGTLCEGLYVSERSPVFLPEMSHMVIFYREEPLMYMDENIASASLFQNCYHDEEKNSIYGLHIHKAGKNYFDPKVIARRSRTKNELMPVAVNILSVSNESGKWISSDIFTVERGQLILRGVRKNGIKFRITADDYGIEQCAQEKEMFEYFDNLIKEKISALTKDDLTQKINSYLETIEKRSEILGKDPSSMIEEERKKLMEIEMIKEYFSAEVSDS